MTITRLIKELNEIKKVYGDIVVTVHDHDETKIGRGNWLLNNIEIMMGDISKDYFVILGYKESKQPTA